MTEGPPPKRPRQPPPQPPVALEDRDADEARLFSPSAARNRDAVRDAFLSVAPAAGVVLEVGSGTGEHAVHIAAAAPQVAWRPGDPDPASRASIAAWTRRLGLPNVAPPHAIDVADAEWGAAADAPGGLDAIVSCNMIHIAPPSAYHGLIAGAGAHLADGGILFVYGPFMRDGRHTAPSNADFDASLQARDPSWGVRDLDRDLVPHALTVGLTLEKTIPMPANNLSVVFRKASG